ncbi:hypothetical protein ACFV6E_03890 [Streptomyces sp. NPDC059785]|uniref:hypothetical protein n=1 Tax=Streptomyces sp. NPDC059785 TaxID=3346945 RepID=UPI00364ACA1F
MATQAILVRLDESATDSDVGALKKWLERENLLQELVRDGRLQIQERAGTDARGNPMGAGMEILLAFVGASASTLFTEVLAQTRRGVRAWRENRRSVESGDPPHCDVDPADVDER